MLLGPSRSPRCALIRDTCNVTIVSKARLNLFQVFHRFDNRRLFDHLGYLLVKGILQTAAIPTPSSKLQETQIISHSSIFTPLLVIWSGRYTDTWYWHSSMARTAPSLTESMKPGLRLQNFTCAKKSHLQGIASVSAITASAAALKCSSQLKEFSSNKTISPPQHPVDEDGGGSVRASYQPINGNYLSQTLLATPWMQKDLLLTALT